MVGHHGEAFFARFSQQLVDFFPMQQQFAAAGGLVIFPIAVRILADVRVEQPGFVFLHFGEAVLELDAAVLGRFDLGSTQSQACFQPFQKVVVVPGMAVVA